MVVGSITSQRRLTVGSSKNGSIIALPGSGIRIMSDSLIPFQPAMEEPSNILPSSNSSSSTVCAGTLTCCSLPRLSVKRKSTNFAFSLAIRSKTSLEGMGNSGGENCGNYLNPNELQSACQTKTPINQAFLQNKIVLVDLNR